MDGTQGLSIRARNVSVIQTTTPPLAAGGRDRAVVGDLPRGGDRGRVDGFADHGQRSAGDSRPTDGRAQRAVAAGFDGSATPWPVVVQYVSPSHGHPHYVGDCVIGSFKSLCISHLRSVTRAAQVDGTGHNRVKMAERRGGKGSKILELEAGACLWHSISTTPAWRQ